MSEFVEAVNSNGVKQRIPKHWLEDGSPFAEQFRLPPSAKPEPEVKPEKPARASAK